MNLESYHQKLDLLREKKEQIEENLIGRRAFFDESNFTHADEPAIITGTIEEVRLAEGAWDKKIDPHYRVTIRTSPTTTHEVAFEYVTVPREDPAEQ